MEVLDKIDAPAFGMRDMELLGMFAGQAALAIEMSQGMELLGDALVRGLKELLPQSEGGRSSELLAALDVPPDPDQRNDLLQLAVLLNEFGRLGEEERRTALKVLAAFNEYGQTRRRVGRGRAGYER